MDAMHECFANPEAMRFWNTPVHSRRIETERAVRRFIDCTPSYYRFWSVADAKTDLCLEMVNYHDGHIRSERVDIGYIVNPSRRREGIGAEAVLAMLQFCFGDLGTHRAQAFIHPDNTAQSSNRADGDQRSFLSPPQRNQPVRLIFLQLNAGARAGKSGSRFA